MYIHLYLNLCAFAFRWCTLKQIDLKIIVNQLFLPLIIPLNPATIKRGVPKIQYSDNDDDFVRGIDIDIDLDLDPGADAKGGNYSDTDSTNDRDNNSDSVVDPFH